MNDFTSFEGKGSFTKKCDDIFTKYVENVAEDYFSTDKVSRDECVAYFIERRSSKTSIKLEEGISQFRWLFCGCFLALYDRIYLNFRKSAKYISMYKMLKERYNSVVYSDFDYLGSLGAGAYGVVLKCRKRSTGVMYAMKLQRKVMQFEQYENEPWRVEDEKKCHASFNHPYIVDFAYALQCETMTMLVLALTSIGDLRTVIDTLPNHMLPHHHCVIYAAEIVAAISYMHEKGVIYRDLKPGNILLFDDGHIRITDLGAVADVHGSVTGVYDDADNLLPVFRPAGMVETLRLSQKYQKQMSGKNNGNNNNTSGKNTHSTSHISSTICASSSLSAGGVSLGLDTTYNYCEGLNAGSPRSPQMMSAVGDTLESRLGLRSATGVSFEWGTISGAIPDTVPGSSAPALHLVDHIVPENGSALSYTADAPDPGTTAVSGAQSPSRNSSHQSSSVPAGASYSLYADRARAKTLVGTMGYMAPEVMALYVCTDSTDGYTFSCDWWSLGATLFKMYTGMRPYVYKKPQRDAYHHHHQQTSAGGHGSASSLGLSGHGGGHGGGFHSARSLSTSAYAPINSESGDEDEDEEEEDDDVEFKYRNTKKLKYDPSVFTVNSEDFIRKLLTMEPEHRLGSGPDPYQELTEHPYFASVNFQHVELKLHEPAPIPTAAVASAHGGLFGPGGVLAHVGVGAPKIHDKVESVRTLEAIMSDLGYAKWFEDNCSVSNGYFEHWNFTAKKVVEDEARNSSRPATATKR